MLRNPAFSRPFSHLHAVVSVQSKHDMARRHGRSFRGLAIEQRVLFIGGERITMIPVMSVHGLLSFELFQAPQPSEHLPRGVGAEHFKAGPVTASPLLLSCQLSLHHGTRAAAVAAVVRALNGVPSAARLPAVTATVVPLVLLWYPSWCRPHTASSSAARLPMLCKHV